MCIADIKLRVMLFDYPFLHVHLKWFSKVVFVQLEQEEKDRVDLEAADELFNEASSKLNHSLSSTPLNKLSVTVAQMMLETAKAKCRNVERSRNIWKRQHTTYWRKLNLLR